MFDGLGEELIEEVLVETFGQKMKIKLGKNRRVNMRIVCGF